MKLSKKKKITFLSLFLSLLIVGSIGGYYIFNNTAAAGMVSANAAAWCKRKINNVTPKNTIPQYLESKYGVPFPETENQSEFSVDFDTYATSWNDYITGKDDGKRILTNLKSIASQVVEEIKKIDGEPYNKIKVVIVYTPTIEDELNNGGMTGVGAFYDPMNNLINYTGDMTSAYDFNVFIHEIVHSFNDGALLIESLEEGFAVSIADLVAENLGYKDSTVLDRYRTKNIFGSSMASAMGLTRTDKYHYFTNYIYNSTGLIYYDAYKEDNNFFKNYRLNISKEKDFKKILSDPEKYTERLIIDTACAEMVRRTWENRIIKYTHRIENILARSLPEKISNKAKNTKYSHYSVLNINPVNKIYNTLFTTNSYKKLDIRSTFKTNDILDVVYAMYRKDNPPKSETESFTLSFDELIDYFSSDSFKNIKYYEMAELIEEEADVSLNIYKKSEDEEEFSKIVRNNKPVSNEYKNMDDGKNETDKEKQNDEQSSSTIDSSRGIIFDLDLNNYSTKNTNQKYLISNENDLVDCPEDNNNTCLLLSSKSDSYIEIPPLSNIDYGKEDFIIYTKIKPTVSKINSENKYTILKNDSFEIFIENFYDLNDKVAKFDVIFEAYGKSRNQFYVNSFDKNGWVELFFLKHGSIMDLYFNGEKVEVYNSFSSISSSNSKITVSGSGGFPGYISELYIFNDISFYDYLLSDTEYEKEEVKTSTIAENYNVTKASLSINFPIIYFDILNEIGLEEDYTGDLKIQVSSTAKPYRASAWKKCYRYGFFKVCKPKGIKIEPIELSSVDVWRIRYNKGSIINVFPDTLQYSACLDGIDIIEIDNDQANIDHKRWQRIGKHKYCKNSNIRSESGYLEGNLTGCKKVILKKSDGRDSIKLIQDTPPFRVELKDRPGAARLYSFTLECVER